MARHCVIYILRVVVYKQFLFILFIIILFSFSFFLFVFLLFEPINTIHSQQPPPPSHDYDFLMISDGIQSG